MRGEDRFRWLSGMVTNTVNDLFPNTGAWNLVLNAQGRIQGDLTVWREGEELSPQRRNPAADAPGTQIASKIVCWGLLSLGNPGWNWRFRPTSTTG